MTSLNDIYGEIETGVSALSRLALLVEYEVLRGQAQRAVHELPLERQERIRAIALTLWPKSAESRDES